MLDLEPTANLWRNLLQKVQQRNVPRSYPELQAQLKENFTEEQLSQAQLVIATVIITLTFKFIISKAKSVIKYLSHPIDNIVLTMFNLVMWLPCGRKYLDKEVKKAREEFHQKIKNRRKNAVYKLPEKPMSE